MDNKNRFHTKGIYWLTRTEHLAVVAVAATLTVLHHHEIVWWRFWVSFWIIDIVGYWPGAFAYKRKGDKPLPAFYYHLYNVTHTYLFVGSGIALWAYTLGHFEWAMLGAGVHLSVDRGGFGNVLKPRALAFEPVAASLETLGELLLASKSGSAQSSQQNLPCDPAQVVNHPSGFLGLSSRNQIFSMAGTPGFITYRKRGGHLVAFGGVHAEEKHWRALLDGFLQRAKEQRCRVLAVQIRANQVTLFRDRGFTVNQFGTSFALELKTHSLQGTRKMKLRNKIARAKAAGLKVLELGVDLPRNRESYELLHTVSGQWLKHKGKKELDFMIGEIGVPEDAARRIFLVMNSENEPVAFITYVPVWGERPGYLHDLTRRVPDAPVGAMELCNHVAMERLRATGAEYLHFGFTPFITEGDEPPGASKAMTWLISKLRVHGRAIYPAETQADYKLKWGSDIREPEFFAARPLSLRAVFDTLTLTRSI